MLDFTKEKINVPCGCWCIFKMAGSPLDHWMKSTKSAATRRSCKKFLQNMVYHRCSWAIMAVILQALNSKNSWRRRIVSDMLKWPHFTQAWLVWPRGLYLYHGGFWMKGVNHVIPFPSQLLNHPPQYNWSFPSRVADEMEAPHYMLPSVADCVKDKQCQQKAAYYYHAKKRETHEGQAV